MKKDLPEIKTRIAALVTEPDKRRYADTLHCNRCGFCTSFCPTYLATGDEGLSPRGRNQALRALLEGRLGDPSLAKRQFDTCLLCGICTSVCFAEVPTAKLMSAAREKVLASRGEPPLLRFALRFVLPRPRLLALLLKALYAGKRAGLSGWLNRAGVLRLISPELSEAEAFADAVPDHFLAERVPAIADPSAVDAVHFMACGPNYILPEAGEATARILSGAGCRSGRADNVCCGLPGVSYGDLAAARALARRNIEELEKYPKAVVLVDDSSCAATIKEYPALFEDEPVWRPRAEALAARTQDLVEWLAKHPEAVFTPGNGATVTYHDPCKARYGEKLVSEPRRVLARVAGAEVRELPEADQCCGGGGTYSFMQADISRSVGSRKISNIISTGADVVLTSAVSCLLQVRAGLRRAGSGIRALHIAEFLSPPNSKK